jgi:hypothetical protein
MYCDSCHQFCRKLRRKVTVVARAMAEMVSCRSLPADTPVQSQHHTFGVCGGRSGTGTGVSSEPFGFPVIVIPAVLPSD